MSIRPTALPENGVIPVVHDDPGYECTGEIALADLAWYVDSLTDEEDRTYLVLPCPNPKCDSYSLQPATGGVDPEMIQRLFARKLMAETRRSWPQARAIQRAMVEKQDGHTTRWRLEAAEDPSDYRRPVPSTDDYDADPTALGGSDDPLDDARVLHEQGADFGHPGGA